MGSTLGELLEASAERFGQRPAVVGPEMTLTYRDLHDQAGRLASVLHRLGLDGLRTGILLPNGPRFPVALHALFRLRGTALLLNPASVARELSEQLADAEVSTVLTVRALRSGLPGTTRCILLDDLPERIHVDDAAVEIPRAPAAGGARFSASDAEAVVIFTSAMEGRSRGASLSHRNLVFNLTSVAGALELAPEDRVLGALPFAHAFGLTVCLSAPLAVGAAVLPHPRFNPATLLDVLENDRPTVLTGVPAIFIGLIGAAAKRGLPAHALRVSVSGGAPLGVQVQRRWESAFGLPLRQGYGLTEAAPVCLFNRVEEPNRIGTLGRALPGVEVSIRDLSGAALGDGEVGELCVRGPNVFAGYLGSEPRESYFHGDWLRTGDLASQRDGIVRFRGTLKAMLTRNGFNVYPEEIRRVLTADPRIQDACVYARPDPVRENEIVLRVRLAPGAGLREADLKQLCQERLAPYKQPARIIVEHPSMLEVERRAIP